jgi:NTP pyrophosphatase (non-canonical NTP hydrolase)
MASGETVDRGEPMSPSLATFNHYQQHSSETAIYPGRGTLEGIEYCVLGLVGESGEIANKLKKVLRDDNGVLREPVRQQLIDELGDVLWYTQQIATELNVMLGEVALANRIKLVLRKDRGTLQGQGDER